MLLTLLGIIISGYAQSSTFTDTVVKDGIGYGIYKNEAYITSGFSNWESASISEVTVPATVSINGENFPVVGFYISIESYSVSDALKFEFPEIVNFPATFSTVLEKITTATSHETTVSYQTVDLVNVLKDVYTFNVSRVSKGCKKINFAPGGTYTSIDGLIYDKSGTDLLYVPYGVEGVLEIPAETKSILSWALTNVQATEVVWGNNINYISFDAFFQCRNLKSVKVKDSETLLTGEGEVVRGAFWECYALEEVEFPSAINSIEDPFYDCKALKSVIMPWSVETMSLQFLSNCPSLTRLVLPGMLKTFPEFERNEMVMPAIEVPENAVSLEGVDGMVYSKGLGKLYYVPMTVTDYTAPAATSAIADYVFSYNKNLKTVDLTNVESIGREAFVYCPQLAKVVLPKNVKNLNGRMFVGCDALNEYVVPSGAETIDGRDGLVFSKGYGKLLLVPHNVANCTLPSATTEIGEFVFAYNDYLRTITFPPNLRFIGALAFYSCPKLTEINCGVWTPPVCGDEVFSGKLYSQVQLYVPSGAENQYYDTYPWSEFLHIKGREYAGVESVVDTQQVTITVADGAITVNAPDGTAVNIYATDGRLVFAGEGGSVVSPGPGVYVVRAGTTSSKVIL